MFISTLELFKIGIGPSSSHTMGPMVAAANFKDYLVTHLPVAAGANMPPSVRLRCWLKGALALTGRGHATDCALVLGLHGYLPDTLPEQDVSVLTQELWHKRDFVLDNSMYIQFNPDIDIIFDCDHTLPEHPNGMVFELIDNQEKVLMTQTYFSIGGGFVNTKEEISSLSAPLKMESLTPFPYPFDTAAAMLEMSKTSGYSIATMKRFNERVKFSEKTLDCGLDAIWNAMQCCVQAGLAARGVLPGELKLKRRAKILHDKLLDNPGKTTVNDWLCAYAMAINEENAAGHRVVTAPTNGAAGVIPALLYYLVKHETATAYQVREFLLTASAIGGIIKHKSSISGAEVGCQGEVGSAAAMAAAGLCAVRGGTASQIENAAEIALEHHLGMTCDPVAGLVQVPCIERNGFGAVKAFTAASLAQYGTGQHFIPLDSCIVAMRQTGLEMSTKYKETSLGGLAVSLTEC